MPILVKAIVCYRKQNGLYVVRHTMSTEINILQDINGLAYSLRMTRVACEKQLCYFAIILYGLSENQFPFVANFAIVNIVLAPVLQLLDKYSTTNNNKWSKNETTRKILCQACRIQTVAVDFLAIRWGGGGRGGSVGLVMVQLGRRVLAFASKSHSIYMYTSFSVHVIYILGKMLLRQSTLSRGFE